ncbi:MAG TPA: PhoPQ-activated protein PqaA family protein [Steroidobacteraceae bacterium]|nr:PhoPQ-activated protein PqaA family protein [Steroidobacteraceae bacterium]
MTKVRAFSYAIVIGAALACALALATASGDASATSDALAAYVAHADKSLEWHAVDSGKIGDVEYVEYLLTSQTWRGIEWKHQLFVLRPPNMARDERHGLLFVHGGRWKPEYEGERGRTQLPSEALLFARLAESIGAPVGVLRQVPFAPMFGRTEDALIAYTFDQYLQTGERDWPLLLPMVKSTVRAMDAMQSIVRERWGPSIESFTVSGASKRGWTAWLTAAVDRRVMAVAPMVIDVLNMSAQMDHQRETWGEVSEEIRDYAALDLPTRLKSERGRQLLSMVDPFNYRAQLTRPKLILLSTNDRYWPLDALNLYWSGLPGQKHVLYVPNQGHGLRDADRVIGGVSALHRYAAAGKPMPETAWSFAATPAELKVQVKADREARRVLAWTAQSPTRDFRDAHWTARQCAKAADGYACSATRNEEGYTALFAETSFQDEGKLPFSTSTTVCIAGPKGSDTQC